MSDKYEWRKEEKALYIPKTRPELVDVPTFKFLTIRGKGSPADKTFTDCVSALYSMAYALKMMPKKMKIKPRGYFDFTVYPLEGVWDINDEAKKHFSGTINKKDLIYHLMIRQPEFVKEDFYNETFDFVRQKKPNPVLEQMKFESLSEGKCIQMLHIGKFEDEFISFEHMDIFAKSKNVTRVSKMHREIYLSDTRKVPPEKLKTVLRFQIK